MSFDLTEATLLLGRTPSTLDALLRGLPPEWTMRNQGGDSWSPFDVVGHLIHGEETDWIPRTRHLLAHGESAPFEPFDRLGHVERSRGRTMEELLVHFAKARGESLAALRQLDLRPEDLDRRGLHPDLGVVTLRHHLATWVVHDLAHLGQIARTLAAGPGSDVGPWRTYLPFLGPE